jgi:hypothetical protein
MTMSTVSRGMGGAMLNWYSTHSAMAASTSASRLRGLLMSTI